MRKVLLVEEDETLPRWVATYHFGNPEYDDTLDDLSSEEVVIVAPDFDIAVRYAQQYLRKMKTDEETSEQWANAEILSVVPY